MEEEEKGQYQRVPENNHLKYHHYLTIDHRNMIECSTPSTTQERDSPRNVMVADRWFVGPTAVFAAAGCGQQYGNKPIRPNKNTIPRGRNKEFSLPFLDMVSTDVPQMATTPKLVPKMSSLGRLLGGEGYPSMLIPSKKISHVTSKTMMDPRDGVDNHHHQTKVLLRTSNNNINNYRRPKKSASIAIEKKRGRWEEEAFNSSSNSNNITEQSHLSAEKMYDWATWKMYTRITDHRRRFPLRQSYYNTSNTIVGGPMPHPPPPPNNDEEENEGNESEPTAEHFLDGEIFELEI